MGRHSSPNQGPFLKSFFGWLGLWLMIAVVTGVGVWLTVAAIGGPEARRSVASEAREPEREQAADRSPAPTVSGALITTETPAVETPARVPAEEPREKKKLVTEGMSVQVLDGTTSATAAQGLADRLAGLGYTVVAVEEASRTYQETTVFWSTESSREAALALAERFGWVAEPKPANLSPDVSLHVVAGADEA